MGDERWQVTGSAAEVYQGQLVPAIFAPWAPRVLDLATPATGERLLDTACGTGVVACQLGLQYFPDRSAAVAEMARVLAPGGRLAVMVWRSIDHSPGFAALADALDRHVDPAAGATMGARFTLNDEAALRDLLAGGGFEDVEVHPQAGTVRFGSVQEFLIAQGTGSPLAAPIAAADPAARAALLADAETTLAPWQGPDGFAFPIGALLLSGRVP